MSTSGSLDSPGSEERTLGQLVASASADIGAIVRGEIEMAKAEVSTGIKGIGAGAGMFGAAAFMSLLALIVLLIAAAEGLIALGLAPWLAYLVVALVLLLIAALLALLGKRALTRAKPVPEKAIANAQQTIAAIKHSA